MMTVQKLNQYIQLQHPEFLEIKKFAPRSYSLYLKSSDPCGRHVKSGSLKDIDVFLEGYAFHKAQNPT